MIRLNKILFFLLFCAFQIWGQSITRLEVITAIGSNYISAQLKDKTIYFSISQFADALSENYNYDSNTKKIAINFDRKTLVFTDESPFYVEVDTSSNKTKVFQIPTNTFSSKNEIFIPMFYSLDIIQKALGRQVIFNGPNRLILGRALPPEPENNVEPTEESTKTEPEIVEENLPNQSYDISDITLDEKANGTLIRLKCNKKISTYNSSYKSGVLTISLKNCRADVKSLNQAKDEGLIKEINVNNVKSDVIIKY